MATIAAFVTGGVTVIGLGVALWPDSEEEERVQIGISKVRSDVAAATFQQDFRTSGPESQCEAIPEQVQELTSPKDGETASSRLEGFREAALFVGPTSRPPLQASMTRPVDLLPVAVNPSQPPQPRVLLPRQERPQEFPDNFPKQLPPPEEPGLELSPRRQGGEGDGERDEELVGHVVEFELTTTGLRNDRLFVVARLLDSGGTPLAAAGWCQVPDRDDWQGVGSLWLESGGDDEAVSAEVAAFDDSATARTPWAGAKVP